MCALMTLTAPLFADGGAVLSRQEAGPFLITVFAAPVPLRAGPIDLTVLVQARDSLQPVLDADVSIHLNGPSEMAASASRSKAQNKLLYAATLNLPQAGQWEYAVSVHNGAGRATISGAIQAGPPAPPLASYAFYLAIPPLMIAIFALHQWLSRRDARRVRSAPCATIKP